MNRYTLLVVAGMALGACGGGSAKPEFNETAVRAAVARDGVGADAVETFRKICGYPDDSDNDFSVHQLIVNAAEHPAKFIATARLACPNKFARVQKKIDRGDCFGGSLVCKS